MANMLISGGTVIDGTGTTGSALDIRIRDGRIVEMKADLVPEEGEQVVYAEGAVVAPGFIDSHTHYDATIYWDPICDPMPQHGVTSVVFGNCALSLAPIRAANREEQLDVLSYIEDLPLDVLNEAVPWRWESYEDYAAALSDHKLGINVCGFVGHSQIRCWVMGDEAWSRTANGEEIAKMAEVLDGALQAGALGLSYSLFDKDRSGRWVPSVLADDAELNALFAVLARHDGVFQFVLPASSAQEVLEKLTWLAGFIQQHGVTGLYNVVAHINADPTRSAKVIEYLVGLHEKGVRLFGMATPRPFELQVSFDQSITFNECPAWNELVQAPIERKRQLADDPDWRARARSEINGCKSVTFPFFRPEMLRIGAVGKAQLQRWTGRPLLELVAERGGDLVDALAEWLKETDFQATLIFPVANTEPAEVAKILKSPATLVSGSDAGAHLQMFCAAGDATLLLTRYVAERGELSLEHAIHELTGRQAQILGLANRGTLAVGNAADIVIFVLDELVYGDEMLVHDIPGGRSRLTRAAGGYRYTIINGTVVQERGQATGALPARWLAKAA